MQFFFYRYSVYGFAGYIRSNQATEPGTRNNIFADLCDVMKTSEAIKSTLRTASQGGRDTMDADDRDASPLELFTIVPATPQQSGMQFRRITLYARQQTVPIWSLTLG